MLDLVSQAENFTAFFTASGLGKTGLTVTVDVYNPAGTQVVTGAAATEIGDGFYDYTLTSGNTSTAGLYRAVFKTTDTTVDARHVPALWIVGKSWVASHPTAAPNAAGGVMTVGTGAGQVNPDGTGSVPVAFGTALPGSPTASTVGEALKFADTRLDAAVSTRLATSGYTAPPTTAQIATAILTDTTAGDLATSGSIGYILAHQLGGAFTTSSSSVFTAAALANAPTGGGSDPWATALPGGYAAGTAGYLVGNGLADVESGVSFHRAMQYTAAAAAGVLVESSDHTTTTIAAIGNAGTPRIQSAITNTSRTPTLF